MKTRLGWESPEEFRDLLPIFNRYPLEELILPESQILRGFGLRITRSMLPFRPDGIYPSGDKMVFFRNATDHLPFVERKLPRDAKMRRAD